MIFHGKEERVGWIFARRAPLPFLFGLHRRGREVTSWHWMIQSVNWPELDLKL